MVRPSRALFIVGCLLLAACTGVQATSDLPTPPPPATLTRVPTVVVPTATSDAPVAPLATAGPTPTEASLFAPVTEVDWQQGPVTAPATLIEYADFQCLYCAQLAPVLARLRQEFPDDFRLVYRHYPLPQHDKALMAAAAVEAAGAQDQFWAMHNLLYENQTDWISLPPEDFKGLLTTYAQKLGLNLVLFTNALDSEEINQRVQTAYQAAVDIPLPGTPFMLFNGAPLQDEHMLSHWALSTLVRLEILKPRQYSQPPPDIINPFKTYLATVQTAKGNIVLELFAEQTPLTVNNFVFLAQNGWFDGVTFHRVIPGFAAQTGDPSGTGYGGPGYFIPDEIVPEFKFDGAGWVGMANSGADTSGSQFFITMGATPDLDGKYTLFGKVLEGMNVVHKLTPRDPNADPDAPPGDIVTAVTIEEQP